MARLGVRASVQPAHLLDDRDVTELFWPDRAERCFPLRWMVDDGVELALGSDAPVSPLDPWLAIAAAVHRSADDRPPWHPEQALTAREALAASVDGQGSVHAGMPADLVLLDADPLAPADDTAEQAAASAPCPSPLTVVAGASSTANRERQPTVTFTVPDLPARLPLEAPIVTWSFQTPVDLAVVETV